MSPSRPDGSTPTPRLGITSDTPGLSWPSLAMIYPSHNPKKPVAVAVQRDGVLTAVQIDIAHASGLLAALAGMIQAHLEAERRR